MSAKSCKHHKWSLHRLIPVRRLAVLCLTYRTQTRSTVQLVVISCPKLSKAQTPLPSLQPIVVAEHADLQILRTATLLVGILETVSLCSPFCWTYAELKSARQSQSNKYQSAELLGKIQLSQKVSLTTPDSVSLPGVVRVGRDVLIVSSILYTITCSR